ncbi:MAG: IS66-like element accessory protein TnpA [Methylocystis sp.]|uniref:IS66-like element accessory protein TnpA n=1 Tax=Methylocystis sp. TaxID=1911079 RepID=UPI003DA496DA
MTEEDEGGVAGAERRRRYWKKEEKRRIVAESFSDGASVAEVARRYGLNANLLFTWRRQLAATESEANAAPSILPVTIAPSLPLALGTSPEAPGRMEIALPGGEKIVVGADVETAALVRVIKALRR